MDKPRVAIVGLGQIGGSIGLALREAEVAAAVVGHDKEMTIANQARKLGAIDKAEWNLLSACDGANVIILATPLGAIEPTLKAIGSELQPNTVIMDTASLKGPVMSWAAESLPAGIHFIGGDPIVSPPPPPPAAEGKAATLAPTGLDAARRDLFQNALFCLVPAPAADPAAVKLAADLVGILGAHPFFLDAAEHDGLLAAVDHLPAVLALGLLEMTTNQPSWQELRKVAGASFEHGTRLASFDGATYGDVAAANRDNLVRWLDTLAASLASIRAALAQGDAAALAGRFDKAIVERNKWLLDRAAGRWTEPTDGPPLPRKGDMFDSLFGTFWRRSARRETDPRAKKPGTR